MNKYSIRTATKAIIIEDGKILLNKYQKGNDKWYTLPGGGQDHNEDLKSNLERECLEEIGAAVNVKDVIFVREFIADNHNPVSNRTGYHQVNIIFECTLKDQNFKMPTQPDPNQIGAEWVSIDNLLSHKLYPLSIRNEIINHYNNRSETIYLGDTD